MAIVKDGMSRLIQTTYLLIENNMKPKVNSPFSFALGKENIKTKNKAHTPPPPKKKKKQNKKKKKNSMKILNAPQIKNEFFKFTNRDKH